LLSAPDFAAGDNDVAIGKRALLPMECGAADQPLSTNLGVTSSRQVSASVITDE